MATSIRSLLLTAALALCACAGPVGPAGPAGPAGGEGPSGPGLQAGPSISAVIPNSAAGGQTFDVSLSGFATTWTSAVQVSFGAGVKVDKINVGSPTGLVATVTLGREAAAGVRDVTVTQGSEVTTFKGGFAVLPLTQVTLLGKPTQGSITVLRVQNNDPAFEFDTTFSSGYTNFSVDVEPAGTVGTLSLMPREALVLVGFDVDAPLGDRNVTFHNRPGPTENTLTLPKAFSVTAAPAPTALVPGTPTDVVLANPYDSALMTFTPAQPTGTYELSVTSSDPTARPTFVLMPKSGKFADRIGEFSTRQALNITTTDLFYLVVFDLSGKAGATYSLNLTPFISSVESEPNDTTATAQAVTLPAQIKGATMSALTDKDFYKVTVTAANVGKKFHVETHAGPTGSTTEADTVIDVLASDGLTSLGGPGSDFGVSETFTSTAIPAAGDYYIEVYSSVAFAADHPDYEVMISFE